MMIPFQRAISKSERMADKRLGRKKSRGDWPGNVKKRTKGSFERDLAASGSNQNSFLCATEESIIAAKLKRNAVSRVHAYIHIYIRACVCVYTRARVSLESRIFSRVRHIVAADWNPHDVPRRSHLP